LLRENITLVSLTNAYNSGGLINFEEKIWFITQIKAGVMLNFSPKTGSVCL